MPRTHRIDPDRARRPPSVRDPLVELQAAVEERSSINELRAAGVKIGGHIVRDDVPEGLMNAAFSTIHSALKDKEKVIYGGYGGDDRLPIREVADKDVLANADAAVALIKRVQMGKQNDGSWKLKAESFKERRGVCDSDEPFSSEPSAAFCSGFLVDSDTIVTAGHSSPASSST